MVVISLDKLIAVYWPLLARNIKLSTRLAVIGTCMLLAFLWSALPFFNWTHISRKLCVIEWANRTISASIGLNFVILVFAFLIPAMLVIAFNIKLMIFLNRFHRRRTAINVKRKSTANCSQEVGEHETPAKWRMMSAIMVAYNCECVLSYHLNFLLMP